MATLPGGEGRIADSDPGWGEASARASLLKRSGAPPASDVWRAPPPPPPPPPGGGRIADSDPGWGEASARASLLKRSGAPPASDVWRPPTPTPPPAGEGLLQVTCVRPLAGEGEEASPGQ